MCADIDLNNPLIKDTLRRTKKKTENELLEDRKKLDLRKIKGKIQFRDDYDYKEMRQS